MNARGVFKSHRGEMKTYIAKISESALGAQVSGEAMRHSLGVSAVAGDGVMAAPADRAQDDPLLGLVVRSDHHGLIRAHRVSLLNQGTATTQLEPLTEGQSLTAQLVQVKSEKGRCLLSDTEIVVDLRGYCDFAGMLQYRLDTDIALVLVSAWGYAQGSARPLVTIENMVNITQVDAVRSALMEEWRAALTQDVERPKKCARGAHESHRRRRIGSGM